MSPLAPVACTGYATLAGALPTAEEWALTAHDHDSAEVKRAISEMYKAGNDWEDAKGWLFSLDPATTTDYEAVYEAGELYVEWCRGLYDDARNKVHRVRLEEWAAWERTLAEDEDRQQGYMRHGG